LVVFIVSNIVITMNSFNVNCFNKNFLVIVIINTMELYNTKVVINVLVWYYYNTINSELDISIITIISIVMVVMVIIVVMVVMIIMVIIVIIALVNLPSYSI